MMEESTRDMALSLFKTIDDYISGKNTIESLQKTCSDFQTMERGNEASLNALHANICLLILLDELRQNCDRDIGDWSLIKTHLRHSLQGDKFLTYYICQLFSVILSNTKYFEAARVFTTIMIHAHKLLPPEVPKEFQFCCLHTELNFLVKLFEYSAKLRSSDEPPKDTSSFYLRNFIGNHELGLEQYTAFSIVKTCSQAESTFKYFMKKMGEMENFTVNQHQMLHKFWVGSAFLWFSNFQDSYKIKGKLIQRAIFNWTNLTKLNLRHELLDLNAFYNVVFSKTKSAYQTLFTILAPDKRTRTLIEVDKLRLEFISVLEDQLEFVRSFQLWSFEEELFLCIEIVKNFRKIVDQKKREEKISSSISYISNILEILKNNQDLREKFKGTLLTPEEITLAIDKV